MPVSDIVKRLRDAAAALREAQDQPELHEMLKEAAETIEGMQRQQMDGELFLDFSAKSPRSN